MFWLILSSLTWPCNYNTISWEHYPPPPPGTRDLTQPNDKVPHKQPPHPTHTHGGTHLELHVVLVEGEEWSMRGGIHFLTLHGPQLCFEYITGFTRELMLGNNFYQCWI